MNFEDFKLTVFDQRELTSGLFEYEYMCVAFQLLTEQKMMEVQDKTRILKKRNEKTLGRQNSRKGSKLGNHVYTIEIYACTSLQWMIVFHVMVHSNYIRLLFCDPKHKLLFL